MSCERLFQGLVQSSSSGSFRVALFNGYMILLWTHAVYLYIFA
jgi:hypothetical protein